jgi:Flp pilus assembly pilin Flp
MLDYLRMMLVLRVKSERGASAVEYGLLMAGVAAACILGFETLRITAGALFSHQNSINEQP